MHLAGRKNSLGRHSKCKTALVIFFAAVFVHLRVLAVQSVVLTWNPSDDTNVTGYNIYYGGASGVYTNEMFVGDVTNATVSGLADGVTYYFAATSVNATGGESGFSNMASYSVPSVATLSLATIANQGVVTGITIMASGAVPGQWALESSPDLINWVIIATGTNSNVNISMPVSGIPSQFFRLESQ